LPSSPAQVFLKALRVARYTDKATGRENLDRMKSRVESRVVV
jgi:hypothetical protein